eukprot:symbB.v1.2.022354.t1/scaffold1977.1/size96879/9
MRLEDGSPLSLDQQLCGLQQLQILLSLHALLGTARLPVTCSCPNCSSFVYGLRGCLYVVLLGYPLFLQAAMPVRRRSLDLPFADAQCVSLSWLVSLCIFLALSMLGGFHAYLVLTNQTTIEFHINMSNGHAARRKGEVYRNPYDLGWSRNFQEVFGPNRFSRLLWMMPYVAKKPSGNGSSFPMVCDLHT